MSSKLRLFLLLQIRRPSTAQKGFTLIELLVVIIIIGILSAIAMPSFLRQANKARQTEAETYIGAINRAQQAYHMEHLIFANLTDLEISITPNTVHYNYASVPEASGTAVHTTATPVMNSIAAYSGRVWLNGGTTESILCKDVSGTPPVIVGRTCP